MALVQHEYHNITGVMEETLNVMTQIFPDRHSIIALSDGTVTGSADAETFLSYASQFAGYSFHLLSLQNLTWDEYVARLQLIDQNSSVLLLSAYQDMDLHTLNFFESLHLIKTNLHVPVFHLWYHGMGNGILGGVLISQYEQARNAAFMAEEVLKGADPDSIPILNKSPNSMVFDYNEIIQSRIPPLSIPNESRIINKPVSFLDEHWVYILAAGLVILFQLVVIFFLWINIRKQQRAEQELLHYQEHLEDLIHERTRKLEESNEELKATQKELQEYIRTLTQREKDLGKSEEKFRNLVEDINNILVTFTPVGVITYINPYTERFFGFQSSELIGHHIMGTIIPENREESNDLSLRVS